jgi:hypothetical protein
LKDSVGFDEVSRRYASGAWLPQRGAKGFRVQGWAYLPHAWLPGAYVPHACL